MEKVSCNDVLQTKWRLNSPAQEEQEKGNQILLRNENKKKTKENGAHTPLVGKEDKKGLNQLQTTILHSSMLMVMINKKFKYFSHAFLFSLV